VKKGNFVQPEYQARTDRNTFLTREERQQMHASIVTPESDCAPMLKDVMLRTKALGKSVEAHFQ